METEPKIAVDKYYLHVRKKYCEISRFADDLYVSNFGRKKEMTTQRDIIIPQHEKLLNDRTY